MYTLFDWLEQRKPLNIALVIGYVVIVILLHDPLVQISFQLMSKLTIMTYDRIIMGIVLVLGLGFVLWFIRTMVQVKQHTGLKLWLLFILLAAMFFHNQMLFVMNMEFIHAAEFGLLALLVYPLFKRYSFAMIVVLLCGYLDELYQYQVLYPERETYFDFNDTIMDQLGIGFALLSLYNMAVPQHRIKPVREWIRSPFMLFCIALGSTVFICFQLSIFEVYASDATSSTILLMNEAAGPGPFWQQFLQTGIFYHVLRPMHGFGINMLLIGLILLLDYFPNEPRRL